MCYPLELPNKEGFTILQHVAIDNYVEMATLLIDSGAKIDKKNRDGRTALMYAAKVRKSSNLRSSYMVLPLSAPFKFRKWQYKKRAS